MCEREERSGRAQSREALRSTTVKLQPRRAMAADYFDASPEHALRMSGAERLHGCLFGRKARRKRGCEIALPAAIRDLSFGKHPTNETIAVAGNRFANA